METAGSIFEKAALYCRQKSEELKMNNKMRYVDAYEEYLLQEPQEEGKTTGSSRFISDTEEQATPDTGLSEFSEIDYDDLDDDDEYSERDDELDLD